MSERDESNHEIGVTESGNVCEYLYGRRRLWDPLEARRRAAELIAAADEAQTELRRHLESLTVKP